VLPLDTVVADGGGGVKVGGEDNEKQCVVDLETIELEVVKNTVPSLSSTVADGGKLVNKNMCVE
jgi:hypothetical protein